MSTSTVQHVYDDGPMVLYIWLQVNRSLQTACVRPTREQIYDFDPNQADATQARANILANASAVGAGEV